MKLSQEELFILSQVYEDSMDKKSIIEELSSIDEEGNFLKDLILKIDDLSEDDLKIVLYNEIQSLSFSLYDVKK